MSQDVLLLRQPAGSRPGRVLAVPDERRVLSTVKRHAGNTRRRHPLALEGAIVQRLLELGLLDHPGTSIRPR